MWKKKKTLIICHDLHKFQASCPHQGLFREFEGKFLPNIIANKAFMPLRIKSLQYFLRNVNNGLIVHKRGGRVGKVITFGSELCHICPSASGGYLLVPKITNRSIRSPGKGPSAASPSRTTSMGRGHSGPLALAHSIYLVNLGRVGQSRDREVPALRCCRRRLSLAGRTSHANRG